VKDLKEEKKTNGNIGWSFKYARSGKQISGTDKPLKSVFDETEWEKIAFLNRFINQRIHNAELLQTKNNNFFIVLPNFTKAQDTKGGENLADVVASISQKLQLCGEKKLLIRDELIESLD